MNDEIKEILDRINNYPEKLYCLNEKEKHLLLDYITNLQQEIEKLNDDKRGMLVQLYKANDKIDKAIEYINENKHLSMFADCRESEEDWNYDLECSANDLLNILQNGSDEE